MSRDYEHLTIEQVAEQYDETTAAWEAFARWLDEWRNNPNNPYEDRSDLELIDVYAKECDR